MPLLLPFFSALTRLFRSKSLFVLVLFPLSFLALAATESQYLETRQVVVLDDGSSGSRLVTFFFGRNNTEEEFQLIESSPMAAASALSDENDGIDDGSAKKIAELLIEGSRLPNNKSFFFIGMTAGKRTNKAYADKLFGMIRGKLVKYGVDEKKHNVEMEVLDGSMEGAYNWLGVNYLYGQKKTYGIVELGGGVGSDSV